jgi:hypothetical protein
VGEAAGGGDDGGNGIGSGNDGNISTTPLWAAPCAPALHRRPLALGAETAELGASGAGPRASRVRRQHERRA